MLVPGSEPVARQAPVSGRLAPFVRRVLVSGTPGALVVPHGTLQFVMAFTVTDDPIMALNVLADPVRLARLDLIALDGWPRFHPVP